MDNDQILCDIRQKCLDILKAYGYNRAQIIINVSSAKNRAEISISRTTKLNDKTITILEVL